MCSSDLVLCASWRSCRRVSKCNSSRFGRDRGTCYFHKKLSFVKENGGANELESLRVTCRYDCLEVPHMLVKFRAKKFHFASDHFVRPRVSVPVVKKYVVVRFARKFTRVLCASLRSCPRVSKCNSSRFGRDRGTCYFQKKLSFVKENGGANEVESLRVTSRYDCRSEEHTSELQSPC